MELFSESELLGYWLPSKRSQDIIAFRTTVDWMLPPEQGLVARLAQGESGGLANLPVVRMGWVPFLPTPSTTRAPCCQSSRMPASGSIELSIKLIVCLSDRMLSSE